MQHTRHLAKLEQLTYFLLLILLPSQLGYHFWPDASLLFGFRIDYLSPTLYLTDLLIVLNATLFLTRHHQTIIPHIRSHFNHIPNLIKIFLLFFTCLIILQLFVTPRPLLVGISLLTIIKLSYLSIYTAVAQPLTKIQVFIGLFISLSWIYILTVLQWFHHGALQGPWYWLGERAYQLNQPGIPSSTICATDHVMLNALLSLSNGSIQNLPCLTSLRPMATFSHPNSLAGYVLITSLLAIALVSPKLPYSTVIRIYIIIGLITVLLLTASQAAWLAAGIATLSFFIPKQWYKPTIWTSILMFCITPLLLTQLTFNSLDLTSRQLYQSAAIDLISKHPLRGLGLNYYLPALQTLDDYPVRLSTLQPVHHAGLLLTTYIGVPLMLFLIYIIGKYLHQLISNARFIPSNYALAIVLAIITTASFDHYWLTLHQNQLLLAITLGMIYTKNILVE